MEYASALYLTLLIIYILHKGGLNRIKQDFARNALIWSGIICFFYIIYMLFNK